jgi:putative Mg2+ transporter-C (MgtC) family protein
MEYINSEYLIRIAMAIILGFLLGLERELTNKYAGLRTHILVCLGACVFTIISIYGFPTFVDGDNVIVHQATGIRDSGRVAAQIVTGIGFIGAGTVLRNGPIIIGLTTAATLWISAAIGMTCGVGMFDVAILTTVLSVAVLTLIRIFERRFLPSSIKQNKRFKITLYCSNNDVIKVQEIMTSFVENIEEFSSKKLLENPEKSKITSTIEICHKKLVGEIYKQLTEQYSFDSVKIQELND